MLARWLLLYLHGFTSRKRGATDDAFLAVFEAEPAGTDSGRADVGESSKVCRMTERAIARNCRETERKVSRRCQFTSSG